MKLRISSRATLAGALLISPLATGADLSASMSEGHPDLKSIGPIAFGPEGILFAADSQSAAIFAIATGDTKGSPSRPDPSRSRNLMSKIAGPPRIHLGRARSSSTTSPSIPLPALPTSPSRADAVPKPRPSSSSVNKRRRARTRRLSRQGEVSPRPALPNAPEDKVVRPGPPSQRNARLESITDIAFSDGNVIVAGLSNEEFASTLRHYSVSRSRRSARAPAVEIFHGAHGKLETRSPVRTFAHVQDQGRVSPPRRLHVHASRPVSGQEARARQAPRSRGTTVAELGNRNRPLDMIVYRQEQGSPSSSSPTAPAAVMKVSTDGHLRYRGHRLPRRRRQRPPGCHTKPSRIGKGIVQLDGYND